MNGRVTRRGAEFLAYYMQGDGEGKDWDYHVDCEELPAEVQYSIAVREDNFCEASLMRGWRVCVAEPMKLRSGLGDFGCCKHSMQDRINLWVVQLRDHDDIAFLYSITCVFDEETKGQMPRSAQSGWHFNVEAAVNSESLHGLSSQWPRYNPSQATASSEYRSDSIFTVERTSNKS